MPSITLKDVVENFTALTLNCYTFSAFFPSLLLSRHGYIDGDLRKGGLNFSYSYLDLFF